MTDFVPLGRKVTTALIALLESGTGRPVGDGVAPGKDGDAIAAPDAPYCIVYPLPGGVFSGSYFAYPEQDADFLFQVTSVALRQDQCQWMIDSVRHAIVGRNVNSSFLYPLTVTGLTVGDRLIAGGSAGVTRQDLLYQGTEDYRIRVFS